MLDEKYGELVKKEQRKGTQSHDDEVLISPMNVFDKSASQSVKQDSKDTAKNGDQKPICEGQHEEQISARLLPESMALKGQAPQEHKQRDQGDDLKLPSLTMPSNESTSNGTNVSVAKRPSHPEPEIEDNTATPAKRIMHHHGQTIVRTDGQHLQQGQYYAVVPTSEQGFFMPGHGHQGPPNHNGGVQHVLIPVEIPPNCFPNGAYIAPPGFAPQQFGMNFQNSPDDPTGKKRRRKNRLCEAMGCNKNARGRTNFCVRHGGGTRCTIEGCEKGARPHSTFCSGHGGGHRCLFSGCNKGALAKSVYCRRHGKNQPPPMVQGGQ